jgi:TRAP-type C4-dicarboxylate transport system permease small subunit
VSEPRSVVDRIDDGIYRAERLAVAGILAVMGLVVFLDVVHRVSTRQGGLFARPVVVGVLAALVAVLALRTRSVRQPIAKGIAVGVAIVAAQAAFVRLVPNGLVWSQTLALALTLWLGTIGASLAAHDRRHLAMDVGGKLWPPSLAPKAAAVGHVVTAVFCLGIGWLGVRSFAFNWEQWSSTAGAAGNLGGLDIPKWFPSLSIPYGMAMLAFRFALEGWRTWRGEVALDADDPLKQLGIAIDADEVTP